MYSYFDIQEKTTYNINFIHERNREKSESLA